MTDLSNVDAPFWVERKDRTAQTSYKRRFLLDDSNTGFIPLVASAICSNIGIGSFVAIFLFASKSAVVGLSVVLAYTLGLVLCGLLAPRIHLWGQKFGWFSLVDLIVGSHRVSLPLVIWGAVAFVFILRAAVQFSALAYLVSQLLPISFEGALMSTSLLIGSYIAIGGYRAATRTDVYYGAIILALCLLLVAGLFSPGDVSGPTATMVLQQIQWTSLDHYKPLFLIGIWLFLPFSPLLAIDNWQRIATARTPQTARIGYWVTAVICGAVYGLIAMVGLIAGAADHVASTPLSVFDSFRALMPDQAPWLADILFITAIVSSIDTFVMPLVTGLERHYSRLFQLRMAALTLTLGAALLAYGFGSVLDTVIAAFNGLVIFLPPIIGAMILHNPQSGAALSSISAGTLGAISFTMINPQMAGTAGFLLSTMIYTVSHWFAMNNPSESVSK